jgi:DNA-binding response OmpR family regulator
MPAQPIGRILIVDDEENLRRTLARILRSAECETSEAAHGREALTLIRHNPYDLVYLDINLPGMNGMQVLAEIRKIAPELPVIILTGFGTLETALEALRLGALDYLLKPFDPAIIVSRTRVLLTERAVRRRKQELRAQIAALHTELQALEQEHPESGSQTPAALPGAPAQERFLKVGRLVMDLQAQRATLGERVLALPPAAFDYLKVLAQRSPQLVDYKTLVSEAQNYAVSAGEARELAKWHVHMIRQAIEDDPQHPQRVLNIRGAGYRLLVD